MFGCMYVITGNRCYPGCRSLKTCLMKVHFAVANIEEPYHLIHDVYGFGLSLDSAKPQSQS